jgi:hypothetical protein
MLACAVAAGCSIFSNATAQSLKPSNVIDLAKVKIAKSACKVNLPSGLSNIQWLDDSRLLASTYWAHCDDAVGTNSKRFETQAALFDIRGVILATDHGQASLYMKGPHGTVAAHQTGEIPFGCPNACRANHTLPEHFENVWDQCRPIIADRF